MLGCCSCFLLFLSLVDCLLENVDRRVHATPLLTHLIIKLLLFLLLLLMLLMMNLSVGTRSSFPHPTATYSCCLLLLFLILFFRCRRRRILIYSLFFFSFPPESRDSRPETHNPKYDKMNTRPWSKRPALGRKRRRRQTCKKTADKTQPSEDVRDEARWLDESDRRDAAANAEGKVISVQESSSTRRAQGYIFFTLLRILYK